MIRAHVAVLECSILQLQGMWYPDLASVGDGEGLAERPEVAGRSQRIHSQETDSRQQTGSGAMLSNLQTGF